MGMVQNSGEMLFVTGLFLLRSVELVFITFITTSSCPQLAQNLPCAGKECRSLQNESVYATL